MTASGRAVNGRHAEAVATVPLDAAAAELDRESVEEWARGGDKTAPRARAAQRYARRLAVDWIADVLGASRGGRAGQAARAQLRLLAWVICGADWRRASRAAGYADGHAAAESFQHGKVWPRLEAAAVQQPTERERQFVAALRIAGLAAGSAVKGQRAVASGAHAVGVTGYARASLRPASATAHGHCLAAGQFDNLFVFSLCSNLKFNVTTVTSSVGRPLSPPTFSKFGIRALPTNYWAMSASGIVSE